MPHQLDGAAGEAAQPQRGERDQQGGDAEVDQQRPVGVPLAGDHAGGDVAGVGAAGAADVELGDQRQDAEGDHRRGDVAGRAGEAMVGQAQVPIDGQADAEGQAHRPLPQPRAAFLEKAGAVEVRADQEQAEADGEHDRDFAAAGEAVAHQHVELEDEDVVEQAVEDEQAGAPRVAAGPLLAAADGGLALNLQADAEHDGQQADELAVGDQVEGVLDELAGLRDPVGGRLGAVTGPVAVGGHACAEGPGDAGSEDCGCRAGGGAGGPVGRWISVITKGCRS